MAIGDHFMATPALRALADRFDGRLALICDPGARETFFLDLPLRAVHEIRNKTILFEQSNPRPVRIRFSVDSLVREVGECDLFLSVNGWHSPSIDDLLQGLSPANAIGFFPSFQVYFPYNRNKHASENAFDIPRHLDPSLQLEDYSGAPALSANNRQRAEAWRLALPASARVLAVHAETKGPKMWPIERFVRVLDAFLARNPDVIVLAIGSKDIGLGKGKYRDRVIPCYDSPLSGALALLGTADLFLGVDSCMLHAADLFRVPGVGLFGPTSYSEYGFRFGPHKHIRGDNQTMTAISEMEVLDALDSIFSEFVLADLGEIT
jgi:ADP-heptose:LPS heptosyltransferase